MKVINKITTFLFTIVLVQLGLSQNSTFTNVDTNYLQPKWMANNLNVRTFRNGDPIYEAKSIEEFYQSEMEVGKATYFVKSFGNKNHFFYNFWAISDKRNIAPIGFKVPSPNEFKRFEDFKGFYSFGYIDINEFVENEGNSHLFWTNSKLNDSAYAFLFDKVSMIKSFNFPMNCSAGLNIRCIGNIEEIVKDSIFNYKYLLPENYLSAVNGMLKTIQSNITVNDNFKLVVNGNVSCNENGSVQASFSKIELLEGKTNQEKLNFELASSLNSLKTVPYYHGKSLMANASFELIFKRNVTVSKTFTNFSKTNIIYNSSKFNKNLLDEAKNRGFFYNTKSVEIILTDYGETILKEKTSDVLEFNAPGMRNAFFCFLPGLGLSKINRDAINFKWIMVGKAFLISSISLGAIAISSKIYSEVYYSRYKNDLYSFEAGLNYKKANTGQKIFISSLGGYALLGLLDFSFTFSIGAKNKSFQHDLNELIRSGEVITLKN